MSGVQSTGYEAARPTHVCAATGKRFEAGERYVATLVEDPESRELARFDFTAEAWEAGRRPRGAMIAVWRPVAGDRPERKSPLLGEQELLELFEGMEPAESGPPAVFRYLLALMLMRKRMLRIADQRVGDQGRPVLRLVRRGPAGEAEPAQYDVVDPGMDEAAVATGIEELGAVLAGGDGP